MKSSGHWEYRRHGPAGADGGEDHDRIKVGDRLRGEQLWIESEEEREEGPGSDPDASKQGPDFVVDADIKGYFSDRRVLKWIRQWLRAGVIKDGMMRETLAGTPQGGVISPLLANIYLLDRLWAKKCGIYRTDVAPERAQPGASHTNPIIVKPRAGKLHAQIERGFVENGLAIAARAASKSTYAAFRIFSAVFTVPHGRRPGDAEKRGHRQWRHY